MNNIPYKISLSIPAKDSENLSPEALEFLVAEDCTRMCSDLFWLIEQVTAEAGANASEDIVFSPDEKPTITLDDAQLLKSIGSVARLGASITARMQTVIATLDDYSRRAAARLQEN